MEEYYTKNQVIELLNKQRAICAESYYKDKIILDAETPVFPVPVKAIPVEKVMEGVKELKEYEQENKEKVDKEKLRLALGKLLQLCKNCKMNKSDDFGIWAHYMGLAQQMMDETDPNGKWPGIRL